MTQGPEGLVGRPWGSGLFVWLVIPGIWKLFFLYICLINSDWNGSFCYAELGLCLFPLVLMFKIFIQPSYTPSQSKLPPVGLISHWLRASVTTLWLAGVEIQYSRCTVSSFEALYSNKYFFWCRVLNFLQGNIYTECECVCVRERWMNLFWLIVQ